MSQNIQHTELEKLELIKQALANLNGKATQVEIWEEIKKIKGLECDQHIASTDDILAAYCINADTKKRKKLIESKLPSNEINIFYRSKGFGNNYIYEFNTDKVSYFWLNIKESSKHLLKEEFIWGPVSGTKKNKSTFTDAGWKAIKYIKKGDIIFCKSNKNIIYILEAKSAAYTEKKPDSKEFNKWDENGFRVDVGIKVLDIPLDCSVFKDSFLSSYNELCRPKVFAKNGNCTQNFICSIPEDAAYLIFSCIDIGNIGYENNISESKNKTKNSETIITYVEPEETNIDSFIRTATSGSIGERRESKLQAKLQEYLQANNCVAKRVRIDIANSKSPLFTDLCDRENKILYELKSNASRESIRTAIGQLIDYKFQIENADEITINCCCVVVPDKPEESLIHLIRSLSGFNLMYINESNVWTVINSL